MKFIKITLLSALMATTSTTLANTGVVDIKGAITGTTCSIPASQMTRGFDIGIIEAAQLAAAAPGEIVRSQDLNFSVTNCPSATKKVALRFSFKNNNTPDTAYIDNAGTAEGVLLAIGDNSGTRLPAYSVIESTDLDASAGTATINAKIQAHRIGTDAPVAGNIDSTVNLVLSGY